MRGRRRQSYLGVALVAAAVICAIGAGPAASVRVDDWDGRSPGPLALGAPWRTYPFYESAIFKQAPAIVVNDGRHALHLATQGEAMRIGRTVNADVRQTPWLVWEWKPLVLPERGDARDRRRNDQAARIMVIFEGMKAIAYMWDTAAPVGTEVPPEELELFQRLLVVVRSGGAGVGQWDRQRRNVYDDYRRVFEEEPRSVTWVGFESHSNDTKSRSATLFGAASFERP